jgi:GT2 family glycosyltransferase
MRAPKNQAAQVSGMALVYVVVLNWNGWRDTIECLESLLRSEGAEFRVIVCDNASGDGSLQKIEDWCEGRVPVSPDSAYFDGLVVPNVAKPVRYRKVAPGEMWPEGADIALVQTGANLGFAGGNNVGIRLALSDPACEFIWLLNNDTVVARDALAHLVARVAVDKAGDCCGSTLRFYDAPESIQALGGVKYNLWTGAGEQIGLGVGSPAQFGTEYVENRLTYVAGASMLLSRRLLEAVGFLCEDYFLYFEELDLALRAVPRFRLCYASESVVYHKEGRSIGTNSLGPSSRLSTFLFYYNKVSFVAKFRPFFLPSTLFFILWDIVRRLLRGDWAAAFIIVNAAFFRRDVVGLPRR